MDQFEREARSGMADGCPRSPELWQIAGWDASRLKGIYLFVLCWLWSGALRAFRPSLFLKDSKKESFFWQKKAIQNRKLTSTTTPQPYPLLMEQDLEVRRLDVISAVKYDLYKETAFCDVLFNSFKCHLPWFIALMSLKWISFFFPSAICQNFLKLS